MNLPNKLTVLRVIMIPFFVVMLMLDGGTNQMYRYIAAAIFIIASFTDFLDGSIARKYGLVTNFGKFMDPLADKLLVCSALICLMAINRVPAWMVLIIIAREFIISGFRLVASDAGVVIAASYWGKFKTISQIVMIIALLIEFPYAFVFSWIAVILTVVSLVDYVAKNVNVIKKGGM